MNAYDKFLADMEEVRKQMKKAKRGKPKEELKRKLEDMDRKRKEYIAWHKLANNR